MNTVLKKAALAAAIASAAISAHATDLIGGGASLPAIAYVGDAFTSTTPNESRLSSSFLTDAGTDPVTLQDYQYAGLSSGSIFDAFEDNTSSRASYCQTGSGTGKRVLLGASGWLASDDCKDYSASPEGFSGPNALPDFAGSDAPLTADDIDTFQAGNQSSRDGLVQVPALGAYIGLAVNIKDDFDNPIGNIDLSQADVCDIFDGTADTWDDVGVASSDPIRLVYRTDSSGTVFAFTQYLASNCNSSGSSPTFTTQELYSDSISLTVYNNPVGASGNGGVVSAVATTDGAIGFANYSNIADAGLSFSTINTLSPASTADIIVEEDDILLDTVLGDNDSVTGLPQIEALEADPNFKENCLAVVDPAIQLTQTYPIVAFTNLLGYSSDNNDAAAVRQLFNEVTAGGSSLPAGYARLSSTKVANIIDLDQNNNPTCID
ncbi:substrate-binding domain-containing protein [Alloalcanivorax xenomutans]|uniref:PstS family phosphate ABC transporter substrate-binding protein n=1 Tax=Alloalcanivorax xenomutans TaxID=1094342 RepID=UPI003A7FA397